MIKRFSLWLFKRTHASEIVNVNAWFLHHIQYASISEYSEGVARGIRQTLKALDIIKVK